jgi:hypothetical protein
MGEDSARAVAVSVMFLSMASIWVLRGPLARALADGAERLPPPR